MSKYMPFSSSRGVSVDSLQRCGEEEERRGEMGVKRSSFSFAYRRSKSHGGSGGGGKTGLNANEGGRGGGEISGLSLGERFVSKRNMLRGEGGGVVGNGAKVCRLGEEE